MQKYFKCWFNRNDFYKDKTYPTCVAFKYVYADNEKQAEEIAKDIMEHDKKWGTFVPYDFVDVIERPLPV